MKEFIVTGRVTLEGVIFYVTAESKEEALIALATGGFDTYDTDQAEAVDWSYAKHSIEENS